MILVIGEHRGGKVNPATWEAIAAAQQLAAGQPVAVCVTGAPGAELSSVAGQLAKAAVQEVVTVGNANLEPYTPDGFTSAIEQAVAQLSPSLVLLPHTYQTRDFGP